MPGKHKLAWNEFVFSTEKRARKKGKEHMSGFTRKKIRYRCQGTRFSIQVLRLELRWVGRS